MNIQELLDWLISSKGMAQQSAKDVLSRLNRARSMLEIAMGNRISIEQLDETEALQNSSKFVKSQLRRAVALYNEYANQKRDSE